MDRDVIRDRLEWLESQRFILNMKDRWSDVDYRRDQKLRQEQKQLEEKLEALSRVG